MNPAPTSVSLAQCQKNPPLRQREKALWYSFAAQAFWDAQDSLGVPTKVGAG